MTLSDRPRPWSARNAWLAGVGFVLFVLLLLVPFPWEGREINAISDLGHAPFFGAFAVASAWGFRRWHRFPRPVGDLLVGIACAMLGLSIEGLQSLVGRNPSWHDAAANTLGIGAGLCALQMLDSPSVLRRLTWAASAMVLLGIASREPTWRLVDTIRQHQEMPMLGSFETVGELQRWVPHRVAMRRVPEHVTEGGWSLQCRCREGASAGMTLEWPPPDWSSWDALTVDVFLPGKRPLVFVVILSDRDAISGDDRYFFHTRLAPGRQRIQVPLNGVSTMETPRRAFRPDWLQSLGLYVIGPSAGQCLFIDNIRLSHTREPDEGGE